MNRIINPAPAQYIVQDQETLEALASGNSDYVAVVVHKSSMLIDLIEHAECFTDHDVTQDEVIDSAINAAINEVTNYAGATTWEEREKIFSDATGILMGRALEARMHRKKGGAA